MTLAEKLKELKGNGVSPLTKDRNKLETLDIIDDTLTIEACDLVTKNDNSGDTFCVVLFKERPDGFYFGGTVLTDLVVTLYQLCEANTREPLYLPEPVKVTANRVKSKNGRTYVNFDVNA